MNILERFARRRVAQGLKAAGLAVYALNTGRVLLLQRSLDDESAGGRWEFPGGKIDPGEEPEDAAIREWQEEVGIELPSDCTVVESITSSNGVYRLHIGIVPAEDHIEIHGDREDVNNPDDPDGDKLETIAWWDLEHLIDNPALRDELKKDITQIVEKIEEVSDAH